MINLSLINDIQNIYQYQPTAEKRFTCIRHYLLAHHQFDLYEQMTAPGIVTYEAAWDWFYTYYVDENQEGVEMAKLIKNELLAESVAPKPYYWGSGDEQLGFDQTPGHVIAVDDYALDLAIKELMNRLKNANYTMYMNA